jgi:hypothetical protein
VTGGPFDIEIGAAAGARRVRFEEIPDTDVSFEGGHDSESSSARENLPDRVEPGVTYRDVRVRWRAGARLVDPATDVARKES